MATGARAGTGTGFGAGARIVDGVWWRCGRCWGVGRVSFSGVSRRFRGWMSGADSRFRFHCQCITQNPGSTSLVKPVMSSLTPPRTSRNTVTSSPTPALRHNSHLLKQRQLVREDASQLSCVERYFTGTDMVRLRRCRSCCYRSYLLVAAFAIATAIVLPPLPLLPLMPARRRHLNHHRHCPATTHAYL